MMDALREAVRHAAAVMISRGKVRGARLGRQRTVLQVTVFKGEVKEGVELFLPPCMSAVPLGGDVLLCEVGGRRDHLVAFVDDPATRITDLRQGEFGFRDFNGQQVVFRTDHLEVTTQTAVVITSPVVSVSGNLAVGTGASGSFTTPTGQVVTVLDGIIVNIK